MLWLIVFGFVAVLVGIGVLILTVRGALRDMLRVVDRVSCQLDTRGQEHASYSSKLDAISVKIAEIQEKLFCLENARRD